MSDHSSIAVAIATEVRAGRTPAKVVTESMRQGDLVLRRMGDCEADAPSAPEEGVLLIAGAHGEHRLMAAQADWDPATGALALPVGGLIVHTDAPHARHGAGLLIPGLWHAGRQRELGLTDAISVPVKD